MYDEDSYRNQIFWIKTKRVFLIILFSIIGCTLGVLIAAYLVDVLLFNLSKSIIITVFTLIFLAISLLLTANTGKTIQDGYWRIAVLRKLTLISKKLDILENLDKLNYLDEIKNFSPNELINKEENISKSKKNKKEKIYTNK